MMKTTKIYFILLFSALICLCTSNLKSQTTSVINTIDLDILPPHGTNVNLAADSNTYTLTVKIDDINSTSNVYFLLGERKDEIGRAHV